MFDTGVPVYGGYHSDRFPVRASLELESKLLKRGYIAAFWGC